MVSYFGELGKSFKDLFTKPIFFWPPIFMALFAVMADFASSQAFTKILGFSPYEFNPELIAWSPELIESIALVVMVFTIIYVLFSS